jgi:hypothetical protein
VLLNATLAPKKKKKEKEERKKRRKKRRVENRVTKTMLVLSKLLPEPTNHIYPMVECRVIKES